MFGWHWHPHTTKIIPVSDVSITNCLAIPKKLFYYNSQTTRTSVPVVYPKEGKMKMSAVDQLIKYIMELTPEQVDKIISQLPRLSALLEESSQPYPPEQTSQIQ